MTPEPDVQVATGAQPVHPEPSTRKRIAMALAFTIGSVVLLTLAAGGVDAVGHTAAHLLPGLFPEGCGGG
jgi:hypothetical protein